MNSLTVVGSLRIRRKKECVLVMANKMFHLLYNYKLLIDCTENHLDFIVLFQEQATPRPKVIQRESDRNRNESSKHNLLFQLISQKT